MSAEIHQNSSMFRNLVLVQPWYDNWTDLGALYFCAEPSLDFSTCTQFRYTRTFLVPILSDSSVSLPFNTLFFYSKRTAFRRGPKPRLANISISSPVKITRDWSRRTAQPWYNFILGFSELPLSITARAQNPPSIIWPSLKPHVTLPINTRSSAASLQV